MNKKILITIFCVFIIAIIYSCKKELYQGVSPTLDASTNISLINDFKQTLIQRKYDEKLSSPLNDSITLKWQINWENYGTAKMSDTLTYYYFKLTPANFNTKTKKEGTIQEVNIKKFLVVGKTSQTTFFRIATYFFTKKNSENATKINSNAKGINSNTTNVNSIGENYSFKNFTGQVVYDNLDLHNSNIVNYNNSIMVKPNTSINLIKTESTVKPNYDITDCQTTFTCTYSSTCNDGFIVTATIGVDGCEFPTYYPFQCFNFSGWNPGATDIKVVCKTTSYPDPSGDGSITLPPGIIAPPPPPSNADPNNPDNPAKIPCPGDPVKTSTIAFSSPGNINGGRFGYTRIDTAGNPQFHDGTDIYAEPNTPLYPVMAGTVTAIDSSFLPQGYPNGYKPHSYGNYIIVSTVLSTGETLTIKYAHLNNIKSGIIVGSKVTVGTRIGLTGMTGNQAAPKYRGQHHVHLQAKKDGSRVNPEPYLRTQFTADAKPIVKPC